MLMAFAARALPFSLAIAVWTGSAAAQTSELKNPVEGQPKAIERGEYVYKKRCSTCHGFDARGYRAPDLTAGPYSRGTSDAQLFRVIMRGIPRTEMPANALDEDDAWALIAYVRTVIVPNAKPDVRGNAEAGERIFWGKANCSSCHMVNGKGGRLGPDLSIVGRARRCSRSGWRAPGTDGHQEKLRRTPSWVRTCIRIAAGFWRAASRPPLPDS
jgi:mono/diheme cytochrome c family protein